MAPALPLPPRARPGLLLAALGALGSSSCGGASNALTGSLDEIASLQFDTVVVKASPNVMVVEYDRFPVGGSTSTNADGGTAASSDGTDVVFKMTVKIESLTLNKGLDLDLTTPLLDGSVRTTCLRAVGQDPRRNLPSIQRGELILDSDVNIGQTASGHFHILFGQGGDLGEGRTVDGSFSANVDNAEPGATP